MNEPIDFAARVLAGAEYLKSAYPGFKIRPSLFDITDSYHCAMGEASRGDFWEEVHNLAPEDSYVERMERAEALGFYVCDSGENIFKISPRTEAAWKQLQEAWKAWLAEHPEHVEIADPADVG